MIIDLTQEELEFIARFVSRAKVFSEMDIKMPSYGNQDTDKAQKLLDKIEVARKELHAN